MSDCEGLPIGNFQIRSLSQQWLDVHKVEIKPAQVGIFELVWSQAALIRSCLTKVSLPGSSGGYWDPDYVEHVPNPFSSSWTREDEARSTITRSMFLACFSTFESNLRRYLVYLCEKKWMVSPREAINWTSLHALEGGDLADNLSEHGFFEGGMWQFFKIAENITNVIRHGPGSSVKRLLSRIPEQFVHRDPRFELTEEEMQKYDRVGEAALHVGPFLIAELLRNVIWFWHNQGLHDGWYEAVKSSKAGMGEPQ